MDTLDAWSKFNKLMKDKIRNIKKHIEEKVSYINFKGLDQKKIITIISVGLMVGVGSITYSSGFSHEISLNGENIGYIKNLVMVDEALEIVENNTKDTYGDKAFFESEIGTEKVRGHNKDIIDREKLVENIERNIDIMKPAIVVQIDGREILVMESEDMVEALLEEAKKPYMNTDTNENIELVEIYIEEDIRLEEKDVLVGNILSQEEAELILGLGQEEESFNLASRDRAIGKVSRALGTRRNQDNISKISEVESEEDPVERGLLNIIKVEKHTSTKYIDYKEEEIKDSSLYKGEKKVKEKGREGKKEIITEITYSNGREISKETLEEKVIEEPVNKVTLIGTKNRPQPKPAPTYNGELGSAIVSTARHYLGVPYRSGGSSPSGFDCSGLTSYVYKQYGVYLPRTTGGQLAYGGKISKSELKPGDLVFFTGHVGIYIGNGNMIHAPVPGKRVEITSIYEPYFNNRYKGATRPY